MAQEHKKTVAFTFDSEMQARGEPVAAGLGLDENEDAAPRWRELGLGEPESGGAQGEPCTRRAPFACLASSIEP